MMEYNIFVDRKEDSDTILNIINECKLNTVIITASKSGIGKSTLSKKISYNLPQDMHCISVHTNPINDTYQAESEYLNSVFTSFFRYYNEIEKKELRKNKKDSFKYFVNSKSKQIKKYIRKQQLNELLTSSASKISLILLLPLIIIKKIFSLDYYDYNKYIVDNEPQTNLVKSNYIKYLLGIHSHFIIIDNFQNIDNTSYKFVEEWLCDSLCNKNVFIFEYTLGETENFEHVIKLRDNLSITGTNVIIHKLEKMKPEYAFKAIQKKYPQIEKKKEDILKYYNFNAKGNIRKIEDYVLCNINDKIEDDFDPAFENISELCNESKLLLAIISLHNGRVEFDCIYDIFKNNNISLSHTLPFCIDELVEKYRLVKIENKCLLIEHASVLDAWDNYAQCYQMHSLIAYREIEIYYKKILEITEKKDASIVQILLELYLKFEPIKIYELLPYIKVILYNNISTKRAWDYLYGFINSIKSKINMFVAALYDIIDWCCDLELIYEAELILKIIENQTDFENSFRYSFSFCKINYLLCNYDKVIEHAIHKRNNANNTSEELYYNLFLIIAYRSTNNYQKMKSIVDLITSNELNKNHSAYGFFLRLAEVYIDKQICAPTIEESVRYFLSMGNNIQAAKSNISLSYIYAINGKPQEALKALKSAEIEIGCDKSLSHIFKVNKACINMLEGKIDYSIWNLLDSAELVTENDFSRLAIINNKIICCIEGINIQQYSYLEHKALELLKRVPDKHMHAILYYNLHLLYKKINSSKSQLYMNLANENHEHCETLSIRLKKKQNNKNTISNYLLKRPWHVCFLSCWEFDFILD